MERFITAIFIIFDMWILVNLYLIFENQKEIQEEIKSLRNSINTSTGFPFQCYTTILSKEGK